MNAKENARPTVGAVEQAQAGNVLADSNSHQHCTPTPAAGKWKICDLLGAGQENAVPLRHLVKVTGLDGRIVRRMIFFERLEGMPILADNQTGYFLPATEIEKLRCARSMKHRAREIERAAHAIEEADFVASPKSAPEMQDDQMRLEEV